MSVPYGVGPVLFDGAGVSNVTATNSVDLGTRIEADGKVYVYCYNAGTTQISVGNGVVASAVSGYSVTVSSTTMVDCFAAVCHHATLTTATYGWLVARGFVKVAAVTNTALTAGDPLVAGLSGTWGPATGAQSGMVAGRCTVATASAGVGEAYVRCLFA